MWHCSLKVRPACNWRCPASQRSAQRCQQWASTGCQHCDCRFLAWFCPSKLHGEETMELSEEVPVQLLGLLTWCSPRQSLLWIYWTFFRNLMSGLQNGVSSSAFNVYQGVSFLLFLTAGREFSLSVEMLDELLFLGCFFLKPASWRILSHQAQGWRSNCKFHKGRLAPGAFVQSTVTEVWLFEIVAIVWDHCNVWFLSAGGTNQNMTLYLALLHQCLCSTTEKFGSSECFCKEERNLATVIPLETPFEFCLQNEIVYCI